MVGREESENCSLEDRGSLKCKIVCQTAKGGEFRSEQGKKASLSQLRTPVAPCRFPISQGSETISVKEETKKYEWSIEFLSHRAQCLYQKKRKQRKVDGVGFPRVSCEGDVYRETLLPDDPTAWLPTQKNVIQ